MDETIGQKVARLRKSKNLGQKELGHKVGRTESWVSKLEDDLIGRPRKPALALLAHELDVTVEYLTGEDPVGPAAMASTSGTVDHETASLAEIGRAVMRMVQEHQNVVRQPWRPGGAGYRRFPIINTVPASDASVRASQLEDEIDIPDAVWIGAGDPKVYRVTGDCMALSGIITGDTVVIDAARLEPRDGDEVIAQLNGALTLKRFYRLPDRIELRPNAPGYETIVVSGADELIIIGTLHGVYRPPKR